MSDLKWIEGWRGSLEGADVLELGCGTGLDTKAIERTARSVICTDIERCRPKETKANFIQLDHRVYLPFSKNFDVVVASLCLHYFRWELTASIVTDISRVLVPGGLLICRLNSARDDHFGASGYLEVEPGLYDVDGLNKRFFDENAVQRLFSNGWTLGPLAHKCIDRYDEPKWVWEFGARYD